MGAPRCLCENWNETNHTHIFNTIYTFKSDRFSFESSGELPCRIPISKIRNFRTLETILHLRNLPVLVPDLKPVSVKLIHRGYTRRNIFYSRLETRETRLKHRASCILDAGFHPRLRGSREWRGLAWSRITIICVAGADSRVERCRAQIRQLGWFRVDDFRRNIVRSGWQQSSSDRMRVSTRRYSRRAGVCVCWIESAV